MQHIKDRFELFGEGQPKYTAHFQSLLSKKLADFDAINQSIIAFKLIHINGITVGLRECDELGIALFDDMGHWNQQAADVDENTAPLFDALWERVSDILYPNLFEETCSLSDKEKIILCALVYEIQSELINRYIISTQIDTETALKIRYQIFTAAHDAVANILPSLTHLLEKAQSQEDSQNHDDCQCVIS